MLVAAGFGTRLEPLTAELPKPALPVGNRPAAWFACDHLARCGVREALVNTHHLGDELRAELEPACPPELALHFVHEQSILGTGGGVRNAWRPEPGEDLIVWNAKLVFAPDLGRALAVHREQDAIATMVLRPLPPGSSFTPVEIDGVRVRRIRAEPAVATSASTRCMYTGVQILSSRAWRDLPAQGDIVEHAYLPWLARGERVAAVVDDSPWLDIGVSLRGYLDANLALASGRIRWPGIEPAPSSVLMGLGARVGAGCHLEEAVLGADTDVAPGVSLRRVVAWRGAHLQASLNDAIVTTSGQVVRVES
ncbi:MAG: NDP-sugar synthase [Polyangiales bacterium]